jgi:hypothetical protein
VRSAIVTPNATAAKPVVHAELGQPVTRMQDQRDDGRAHAVEDRGDPGQAAEVDVERAQQRDDHEVRQNECPAARPRAPEAAAQIGGPDADLDGERAGQRLADRDALTHLALRHPAAIADQLALHLADEGDGAAEAEQPEPQVVANEIPNRNATRIVMIHRGLPPGRRLDESECND